MYLKHIRRAVVLSALALCLLPARASAAITPEQRTQATEINNKLKEAGKLILKKKNVEAVKLVTEAQTALVKLAASGKGVDFKGMVTRLMSSLKIRRRILERRKLKLPPLPDLSKKPATGGAAISFTKQITPMLVTNCRNCHINKASGKFSMATFKALMNGVAGASVIQPGSAKLSRIMEVLEKGEMPKGGRKLAKPQIAMIATWINQGAKFDGDNATASIIAGQPSPQKKPPLTVVRSTGKETIKFSRDIAPVLLSQCVDCHGGQRPRARLSFETFSRLLRGSMNGPVLTPGKSAASLIIKKLKGTAEGARMPAGGRKPLPSEMIAKFEKWIAEGAKFDGPDAEMQTAMVTKIYAVKQMSHEELSKERLVMAGKNWKLSNPDDQPNRFESDDFLVMGSMSEDRLAEIGKTAQKLQSRISPMLGAPSGQPMLKGRLTMFVFSHRFEYSEYAQMVEKRSIPRDWRGHWRYNIVDAYACIYPPRTEEDGKLDSLMAEQIAGAYVDSLGKVPKWFVQGTAWEIASRIDKKDARIVKWNARVPEVVRQLEKPDDFLNGKLSAGDAAILNYSFMKFLMGKSANYKSLLGSLRKGVEFKQAFVRAYRGEPSQAAQAWARGVYRKRKR